MEFLGIKIDKVSLSEALERARGFLRSGGQYKIFTPNPEMVVKARKDEYFKNVLNAGDLNLCDGFGLWLALKLSPDCHSERAEESFDSNEKDPSSRLTSGLRMTKKAERVAGIDFMSALCRSAAEQGSGVYLLGSASEEIVKKTADNLKKLFPGLKIVGWDKGPEVCECHCEEEHSDDAAIPLGQVNLDSAGLLRPDSASRRIGARNDTINKINAARPDILFVAFGMGKQEKWIHENLSQMPSVRIAMGVGGAFDYISGAVRRAPLFLRKIGLEWMYRLFVQPRRFFRIFNATVVFILLVLKSKFFVSHD